MVVGGEAEGAFVWEHGSLDSGPRVGGARRTLARTGPVVFQSVTVEAAAEPESRNPPPTAIAYVQSESVAAAAGRVRSCARARMGRFDDRTILVIGASAGIGAALGQRLAAEGACVYLAARRVERLKEIVSAIETAGGRAHAHACDLADADSTAALFRTLERDGVVLDAIVNTAAVLWVEPFVDQVEDRWNRMLATNLGGAMRVTQHALRAMLPRDAGHILHLTSTAAGLPIPMLAVYSATKAGLSHFLAALRGEYGRSRVRFTELRIGNTGGTEAGGAAEAGITAEAGAQLMRWTGLPEMLAVEDVVEAALFILASPPHVRLDLLVVRERAEIPT